MKQYLFLLLFAVLLASCEDETLYPLASFELNGNHGSPGFIHLLDASKSISFKGNLQYRWNTEGGQYSEWETEWLNEPNYYFTFPDTYEAVVGVAVKDDMGHETEYFYLIQSHLHPARYFIENGTANTFQLPVIRYYDLYQNWYKKNLYHNDSAGIVNPYQTTPIISGSYYRWDVAMQKFNIAENKRVDYADFWEIPSLDTWQMLIEYFGGNEVAGYNLTLDLEKSLNLRFAGIVSDGNLTEFDEAGYYWTSTMVDEAHAYAIKITPETYRTEVVILPIEACASVRLYYQHVMN